MTSTSMPWVKLFTEMLDDAKLLPLSEPLKWRFVQLILLAGDCDQGGWLANNMGPLAVDIIALRLRAPLDQLKKDLARLLDSGLMAFDRKTGAWMVTNFEKRQGRPQSKKRELWREQKGRQRRVLADTAGTPPSSAEGVRLTEEDLEEEKEEEGEEEGELRADAPAPANPDAVGEFGERSTSAKQPADLPAPIRVYEESGGKYQSGNLIDGTSKKDYAKKYILAHVKDTAESLELWGRVVFGYQTEWSPKSYTVMVNDYYLRGRVPGQPNGTNGQRSTMPGKYDALLRSLEAPENGHAE
jgi:N-terminal phage replisome organiser (Phage_rep_org_N)